MTTCTSTGSAPCRLAGTVAIPPDRIRTLYPSMPRMAPAWLDIIPDAQTTRIGWPTGNKARFDGLATSAYGMLIAPCKCPASKAVVARTSTMKKSASTFGLAGSILATHQRAPGNDVVPVRGTVRQEEVGVAGDQAVMSRRHAPIRAFRSRAARGVPDALSLTHGRRRPKKEDRHHTQHHNSFHTAPLEFRIGSLVGFAPHAQNVVEGSRGGRSVSLRGAERIPKQFQKGESTSVSGRRRSAGTRRPDAGVRHNGRQGLPQSGLRVMRPPLTGSDHAGSRAPMVCQDAARSSRR